MGRIDHNLTAANRLFATTYWNKRREDRYNWAQDAANATNGGSINGFFVTKGYDYRSNVGVTGGYTSALSSRLLFDLRTSWARFGGSRDPAQDFDPAKLGVASSAQSLFTGFPYLPPSTF